jgi:hypothetical protein
VVRATYRVLAYLVPVIVALQTAFIAFALFGITSWVGDHHVYTKGTADRATGATAITLHSIGAMALVLVVLALLVVSFFADLPGGTKWAAFIVVDVLVQYALAFAAFAAPVVGVLHGLNAFVVFGLAMAAAARATRAIRESAQSGQTA